MGCVNHGLLCDGSPLIGRDPFGFCGVFFFLGVCVCFIASMVYSFFLGFFHSTN